jgi:pimeloyl-ACP methyl ester carboxylesterase
MDARPFAALADRLAVDHTVLTADPRGISRSRVSDPGHDSTPEMRADDLSRLIDSLDAGPATVMGSSGGAVTAPALGRTPTVSPTGSATYCNPAEPADHAAVCVPPASWPRCRAVRVSRGCRRVRLSSLNCDTDDSRRSASSNRSIGGLTTRKPENSGDRVTTGQLQY